MRWPTTAVRNPPAATNTSQGHNSLGMGVISCQTAGGTTAGAIDCNDSAYDPYAQGIYIHDNTFMHSGYDPPEGSIAAAVALSQIVNIVTTVILLVVIGLLTGSGVSRFKIAPSADILIAVGAIVVLIGFLLLVGGRRE